jgi:flagellar M-ring protein FliF
LTSLESVVQDTIGYDNARGDKVTVRDFKFLSTSSKNGEKLDENGNVIVEDENIVDTLTQVKTILKEFGEYFQYLIIAILLFVFYKKFIANNEVVILSDGTTKSAEGGDDNDLVKDMLTDFENEFDSETARGRLKSKVKSQILNNIDGLDEESAARYAVFIEELDKEINENPAEIAKMIELLLSEGDNKFRS